MSSPSALSTKVVPSLVFILRREANRLSARMRSCNFRMRAFAPLSVEQPNPCADISALIMLLPNHPRTVKFICSKAVHGQNLCNSICQLLSKAGVRLDTSKEAHLAEWKMKYHAW